MADDASNTVGGGLRNWLGALGSISALIGAEMLKEGGFSWIAVALILLALPIYWSPVIWNRLRGVQPVTEPTPMGYLHHEDLELGPAIRDMAWRSAWAKWFKAQSLATNDHHVVGEQSIMNLAAGQVTDALIDGRLEARGRKPGQMNYEPIPQTYWRSTALYMIHDDKTIWKMILVPTGGVEIQPDGTVIGRDKEATQRTNQLAAYDSWIVNARQFEKLWPRNDKQIDAATKKLMKTAKKAGADPAELEKLSRG